MNGEGNGAPAVEAAGVTLAHGALVAVERSDFSFPAGSVSAVIGPNGSGKSTLLHAVAGLLRPRTGSISVLGRDAVAQRSRTRYVPQVARINEQLPITVREVVTMARYASRGALGRLGRADRAAVDTALERLEVADLGTRHLRELSGGQRQRVAVAQGLAQDGELLLLDEPSTGLDLLSSARISRVVAEERAAGRAVVVSTHDLEEAGRADHVLLVAGRAVAEGSPSEVLTAANLATAYRGSLVRTADGALVVELSHDGHANEAPSVPESQR